MKTTTAALLAALLLFVCAACGGPAPASGVVASAGGVELTQKQLSASLRAYISSFGMTVEELRQDPGVLERLKSDFVNTALLEALVSRQPEQWGYEYNEAEQAAFAREYAALLDGLDETNRTAALAAGAAANGQLEERLAGLREEYFAAMGHTAESFEEAQRRAYVTARVRERVLAGVELTGEELRAHYDRLVEVQRQSGEAPGSPGLRLYYPEGYRYVKALYLPFAPETILANLELYSAGALEELEAAQQAALAEIQEEIDAVAAGLARGEDFDSLVAQYGRDDGMALEPYRSRGYFTPANDPRQLASYREAADSLRSPGEVAQCVTYKGYWFLYAQEVVPEGAAPFEEVEAALGRELLAEKQALAWEEFSAGLRQEALDRGEAFIDMTKFEL